MSMLSASMIGNCTNIEMFHSFVRSFVCLFVLFGVEINSCRLRDRFFLLLRFTRLIDLTIRPRVKGAILPYHARLRSSGTPANAATQRNNTIDIGGLHIDRDRKKSITIQNKDQNKDGKYATLTFSSTSTLFPSLR